MESLDEPPPELLLTAEEASIASLLVIGAGMRSLLDAIAAEPMSLAAHRSPARELVRSWDRAANGLVPQGKPAAAAASSAKKSKRPRACA